MTWDELLDYCLAKPGAWQDEPWEGDVVAKVGPKIFAFLGTGREGLSIGLKCGASREAADEWVLRFPGDASAMRYIRRARRGSSASRSPSPRRLMASTVTDRNRPGKSTM